MQGWVAQVFRPGIRIDNANAEPTSEEVGHPPERPLPQLGRVVPSYGLEILKRKAGRPSRGPRL